MSPCLLWTCPSSVSWWGLGNGDDKCMIAMPVGMSTKLFHCQSVFRVHYSFYFTITLSTQNRGMMNGHISCIRWAQQRDYTRAVPPGGRERGRTDMLASASCLFPMCVYLTTQACLTLCDPMGILQARILEWVAMPSSRGSSQPRDQTQVSRIAGGFFTVWATRETPKYWNG